MNTYGYIISLPIVIDLSWTVISYDPLYRLTAADYSNGDYYHYSYDAVGNRKTQTSMVNGLSSTVDYDYDDANRLTTVNGVTYTWDANGNLLNDGVNTYTYNSANRLKTMTGPSVAAGYSYNGMGDRLRETIGEQTTTFAMDYNTGLTQVLNDGTNNYIYGNERIAQVNTGTEYFLGDALGSVRQLTNNNGAVTYASAYDPYGVVTNTYGAAQTAYGYTNEYTSQGLVYLRARFYSPSMGRFLTKDTWGEDENTPMSYNAWLYVYANPINLNDPSGHDPWWCEDRVDKDLCYINWNVNNGGKLTAGVIKSIYNSYPDSTLQLIQRQFGIKLPIGYSFRMAVGGTAFNSATK